MTSYIIMAVIAYALLIVAAAMMTLNLRRFVSGEFKTMVQSLAIGVWFLIVPYLIVLFKDVTMNPNMDDPLGWAIYGGMVIAALYFFKMSILFHGFSKTYGFADKK